MKTEIFRLLAAALFWLPAAGRAVEPQILTVAVFDFEAKDDPAHDLGSQVASLLNAQLSARTELMTVERAELAKVLGEHAADRTRQGRAAAWRRTRCARRRNGPEGSAAWADPR